ncbi:MAG: hypothetical protein H7A32_02370 [Deltaproteobacteria bacterium]|nr:hypothetical protein [Deltaproteobacteria bacterium]
MAFWIEVISQPFMREGEKFCYGEITIGDYSEKFEIPLSYWEIEDYQYQWKSAIKILLEKKGEVVLVKSVKKPEEEKCILWWMLRYQGEHDIRVHKEMVILDGEDFLLGKNHSNIYRRGDSEVKAIGPVINEWKVTIDELKEFLEGIKKS